MIGILKESKKHIQGCVLEVKLIFSNVTGWKNKNSPSNQ